MTPSQPETWRILHIDDDEDDYYIVREFLSMAHGRQMTLDWASSIDAGRHKLYANHYHAVLVDYDLGGMTGIDLIREFVDQDYPAPLILLTGRGSAEIDNEAMLAGATLYLTKREVNPLLLERLIRYAIERKQGEQDLRESEKRYSALFNAKTNGIAHCRIITDEQGQPVDYEILQVNDAYEQITGIKREQIEGRRARDVYPDIENLAYDYIDNFGRVALHGGELNIEVYFEALQQWLSIYVYQYKPGEFTAIFSNITERKQAEEEILQSRVKLEAALASMTDAVFISDTEGKFVEFNDAFATFHRFSSKAECARTLAEYPDFLDVYLPDGSLAPVEMWAVSRALRGETVTNAEYSLVRKDTSDSWVGCYSFAPIRDIEGKIIGSVVVGRDITEQKQAEQRLQESRQKVTEILESISDGFFSLNRDWVFTYLNKRAAQNGGYEAEDLIGQNVWEKVPFLKGNILETVYRQVMESGEPTQLEWQGGASPSWYSINVYPSAEGISVYMLDITGRKQAEQALRESENRFRTALASAPITVYTTDSELRVTWMHDRHPSFVPENVLGLRLDQLLPGEYGQELAAIQQSVIDTGKARRGEIETLIDGERAFYTYYIDPVRDADGHITGLSCAGYDITQNKHTEENLAHYTQELERSNQALQDFAFLASHDLKEPLRKIIMFGDSLRNHLGEPLNAEAEDTLGRMQNAAARMKEMIEGLLDLSKVNTDGSEFVLVDMSEIAQEVILDLVAYIQASGGQVIVGQLPAVAGDPLQLRQLLQNLVSNGLKYRREGIPPVVKISAEGVEMGKHRQARIVVEDNGIGFDEANAERIFQPFVRLNQRSQYEGSGIGLAVSRKIAERHGGSLTASSQPGKGSRFTITLPTPTAP